MSVSRNTTYNVLGAVLPAVFSLALLPPFLRLVGDERYGVLTVLWLLLGYFSLLDLGLGRAVAQRVASLRDGPEEEREDTFWSALVLNVLIGAAVGGVAWAVAALALPHLIDLEAPLAAEIRSSAPWLAAAVPVATVSGVMIGALHGRERFLELNLIGMAGALTFQLLPLGVAFFVGPALPGLVASVIIGRLLTMGWMFLSCRRHLPLSRPPRYRRELTGTLLRFGGWVTVSAILLSILTSLDRVLVGAFAGARAVTHYAVPYNLTQRLAVFPAAVASALFPRLAAGSAEERARVARESMQLVLVVVTPCLIVMACGMAPFLAWWLGSAFADEATLAGILLLPGVWASCVSRMTTSELEARGKPELVAKAQLAQSVPYLLFLIVALKLYGIEGAAVSWSTRALVNAMILHRFSGARWSDFRELAAPAALVTAALLLSMSVPMNGALGLALFALLFSGTCLWSWRSAPPVTWVFLARFRRAAGPTVRP